MHGDEIRMPDARGDFRLAEKAPDIVRIGLRYVRIEDLERIKRVQHLVPHEIDGPNSALAQQSFDRITVEVLPRLENVRFVSAHATAPDSMITDV